MLTRLRSLSLRAKVLFVLLLVLLLGTGPAYAYWTAQRSVDAQTFTLGTLDIQLNGSDAPAATFTISNMVPGNSVAALLTVKNNGTLPLSYWLTIGGSNADGKALANSLDVKALVGGTAGGTAPARTCSGGSAPAAAATSVTTSQHVLAYGSGQGARQTLMPGASSTSMCVQITLNASAPSSVQGGSTTVTVTANGAQVGAP